MFHKIANFCNFLSFLDFGEMFTDLVVSFYFVPIQQKKPA